MKASEIIHKLTDIIKRNGDVTVYMGGYLREGFLSPVNAIDDSECIKLAVLRFDKKVQRQFHDKLLSMSDEEYKAWAQDSLL